MQFICAVCLYLPHCRKAETFCQWQTVQFICAVCLFYRIAERQRLSANDKQYNLFALFVCFTALQKGKDFLPMTNSAVYLRCLSVSSASQKGRDFLPMTNSAAYLRCLSMGTTQVPVALQTTMGSSRKSHAESLISVRGTITLRASKLILRELLPIWVISPYASI